MDALTKQLTEVQDRHGEARTERAPDGHLVLVVPHVAMGDGWSHPVATVRVLIPAGYPQVNPDCFYTEAELRLATGAEPANSSIQSMFGAAYRWFSWHLGSWDPIRGSLDQYLRFCERRLKEAR